MYLKTNWTSILLLLLFIIGLGVIPNEVHAAIGKAAYVSSSGNEIGEKSFKIGVDYFKQKQYDSAIEEFTKALDNGYPEVEIIALRGECFYRLKQYEEAIRDLTLFLKYVPNLPYVYVLRGDSYIMLHQIDLGIKDISQAIRLDPKTSFFYYERGKAYLAINRLDMALADFNATIELNFRNVDSYYYRGLVFQRQGKNEEAIKDLSESLKFQPNNFRSLTLRGILYACVENYDKALEDFNRILIERPNNGDALRYRGWLYDLRKETDLALRDLNQSIESGPKDRWIYFMIGRVYLHLGEIQKAYEENEKALALKDDENFRPDIIFQKGLLLLMKNHFDEAEDFYRRGIVYATSVSDLESIDDAMVELRKAQMSPKISQELSLKIQRQLDNGRRKISRKTNPLSNSCHHFDLNT